MNRRIFVEKKPTFTTDADTLLKSLQSILQTKTLHSLRKIQVYDVFHLDGSLFEQALSHIFTEPVTDQQITEDEISLAIATHPSFCIEALPGQFDQRADSAEAALLILGAQTKTKVKSAILYLFNSSLSPAELEAIKKWLLNPVDSRFKNLAHSIDQSLPQEALEPQSAETLTFFNNASVDDLAKMKNDMGLAMEFDDLLHIQNYFKTQKRNPTVTELRVFDTYWSDHCRHTTFETALTAISFEKSRFKAQLQQAYDDYLWLRNETKRHDKPQTLMDMATIFPRFQRATGALLDLEVSEEINACSIRINVDIDGKNEPWLLMFKNETHNHPTEIEPFGGASTCIGGAIRDPLSGRAYVYQAMRITGAGNILEPVSHTLKGKLPQQMISKVAAHGYSSYGNQIGVATTYVKEFFHPGFVAKRMEVGAVVGAVPESMVRRETPKPTDVVIMLGGKTGRDGIGGATGSSKVQTVETIDMAGSEVQKGNAIEERKIQRLFRDPNVTKLIKKSNDFGAGGVSVAIGELAAGVDINLDQVPLKYQGLNGTELAISESQERMAVVVAQSDAKAFIQAAALENIEAVIVATVTLEPRLIMRWGNEKIVDIERSFLDTNGVRLQVTAEVVDNEKPSPFIYKTAHDSVENEWRACLSQMNHASQKGLQTLFDCSIGRSTVLHPQGGKYQLTPAEASIQKIPTKGFTHTVSLLAHGYNPLIGEWSPFHGASFAVIEATARIVASGANWEGIRFSFQEYFERMDKNPQKFGKPVAALLGALSAQKTLGLPSIGGKDSMSGSFEALHVPPTLIAFAVATAKSDQILSPEFKASGHYIYLIPSPVFTGETIDYAALIQNLETFVALHKDHTITAASSLQAGGTAQALAVMMMGNQIGARLENIERTDLFRSQYGAFVITTNKPLPESTGYRLIGQTQSDFAIEYEGKKIAGTTLLDAFTSPLEPIYPTRFKQNAKNPPVAPIGQQKKITYAGASVQHPIVYVPVFPGTNCEYDGAKAFTKAGATVNIVPFVTLDSACLKGAIEIMVAQLQKSHILLLSGGFSAADEPAGSGKFIVNVLKNEKVRSAIEAFIASGGLILGICNGFQALVKSGLLPFGHFEPVTEKSPTLFNNDANQHVATMVQTKIINTQSPWLNKVSHGAIHTLPVSHGEGKFCVSDELLEQLIKQGQIIAQYVDFEGNPTMNYPHNPNGSTCAIEGIISPNGQILGKMAHSERFESGLFQNIDGDKDQYLFESAVDYFRKV